MIWLLQHRKRVEVGSRSCHKTELHGSVSSWCEPIQRPDIPEQMKAQKGGCRTGQAVFKDLVDI